jgi:hypothetical protein
MRNLWCHHLTEAHAQGQRVAHGGRPVCRRGVVERSIESL